MLRIDPLTLYTRSDLSAMLEGSGVDVDTFIARIKARKVFKMLWLGEDLLAAIRLAPALAERSDCPAVPKPKSQARQRRQSATAPDTGPGSALLRAFPRPKANQQ